MDKEMHAGDGDQSKSSPENGGSNSNLSSPELPNHSSTILRRSQSADNLRFPGAADMDFSKEDLDDSSIIIRRSQSADNLCFPGAADMDFSEDDLDDLGDSISMSDDGSENSVDGSSSESIAVDGSDFAETSEAKKSVPPGKLVKLRYNDPKRAKRIMANRKSARRSRERRALHLWELEKSVRDLQNEDASLSTHLATLKRDTETMTNQNAELRLHLQALEARSQLREAVNDGLREEIEGLRLGILLHADEGDHWDPQEAIYEEELNIQHSAPYSDETSESEQDDTCGESQDLDISSNSGSPESP